MTVERGLVSISNNMAEERPPTNEEIQLSFPVQSTTALPHPCFIPLVAPNSLSNVPYISNPLITKAALYVLAKKISNNSGGCGY